MVVKKPKRKRVCTLNPKQNKAWEFAFTFYLDEGHSDSKATKLADRDLIKEFPSLKKCTEFK